jgi:hypothetical protein
MDKTKSKVKAILSEIKHRLRQDVIPSMNKNCRTGGYFSVPLILFPCIELLGILWKNPVEYDNKTKKKRNFIAESHVKEAVEYIRKYLGRIRQEYRKFGGVLYSLYRHSLTHIYQPSVIKLNNNERLSWKIAKNSSQNLHLNLEIENCGETRGQTITYKMLSIDLDIFYQDILKSIDELEKDALKFKNVRNNIIKADRKINRSRPANSLSAYSRDDLIHV